MAEVMPTIIVEVADTREKPSETYKIDFERGRIIGRVDELDAVVQAAYKAILTPRFESLLYDSQYGSELAALFRREDITPELVEAEVPRIIKDALKPDTRITDVRDIEIQNENDAVYISFEIETIYGTKRLEVNA